MSLDPTLTAIRDYMPGDRSFILATWLRGLYYGDTYFSEIPKDIFMAHYHRILEKYLDGNATVKVCCLRDDPEVILGYSVYRVKESKGVLDFIFVKKHWRKLGIGKSLLPPNFSSFTHLTKLGKSLKPENVTYNPFA